MRSPRQIFDNFLRSIKGTCAHKDKDTSQPTEGAPFAGPESTTASAAKSDVALAHFLPGLACQITQPSLGRAHPFSCLSWSVIDPRYCSMKRWRMNHTTGPRNLALPALLLHASAARVESKNLEIRLVEIWGRVCGKMIVEEQYESSRHSANLKTPPPCFKYILLYIPGRGLLHDMGTLHLLHPRCCDRSLRGRGWHGRIKLRHTTTQMSSVNFSHWCGSP